MAKTEKDLDVVLFKFVNKIIKYIDDINTPNEKLFMSHDNFNHSVFFQRLGKDKISKFIYLFSILLT